MKVLEINYNQVVDIHDYKSVEEAYEHYAKNIIFVECPVDLDVRIGWGYLDGEFVQPSAPNHYYYADDDKRTFLLIPDGTYASTMVEALKDGRKLQNKDIIQEEIDNYTAQLIDGGLL